MSKLMLAQGTVGPDAPLTVQLIKSHHPNARPVVVITWPHITEVSPAKLAQAVSDACRILSNASIELARRRIIPERS